MAPIIRMSRSEATSRGEATSTGTMRGGQHCTHSPLCELGAPTTGFLKRKTFLPFITLLLQEHIKSYLFLDYMLSKFTHMSE